MRETYWDQFMTTGSVQDYLNYKMKEEPRGREVNRKEHQSAAENGSMKQPGVKQQKSMNTAEKADSDKRKEQCESDRTYRDGAFHSTGW